MAMDCRIREKSPRRLAPAEWVQGGRVWHTNPASDSTRSLPPKEPHQLALSQNDQPGHRPVVLVVGDSCRNEFANLRPALECEAKVWLAADANAASRLVKSFAGIPDLIVFLQTGPVTAREKYWLGQLTGQHPLVPLVVVTDSWAESESRTHRAVEGVLRIPWYKWPFFWTEFQRTFRHGYCSAACLPSTMTPEEHALFRTRIWLDTRDKADLPNSPSNPPPEKVPPPLSLVLTPLFENYRLLADILALAGFEPVWMRDVGEARLAHAVSLVQLCVVDMLAELGPICQLVGKIRKANPAVLIIVLMCFPCPEETRKVSSLGNVVVLDKPFELSEVLFAARFSAGKQSCAT